MIGSRTVARVAVRRNSGQNSAAVLDQRARKSRHKDRWIAAEHAVGSSQWTLSISPTGRVVQEGSLEDENGEVVEICHELMLDPGQLTALRILVESFLRCLRNASSQRPAFVIDIHGVSRQTIGIWHGSTWHTRSFEVARFRAHSGEIDAQGFIDLWDSIHEYAAFR